MVDYYQIGQMIHVSRLHPISLCSIFPFQFVTNPSLPGCFDTVVVTEPIENWKWSFTKARAIGSDARLLTAGGKLIMKRK